MTVLNVFLNIDGQLTVSDTSSLSPSVVIPPLKSQKYVAPAIGGFAVKMANSSAQTSSGPLIPETGTGFIVILTLC